MLKPFALSFKCIFCHAGPAFPFPNFIITHKLLSSLLMLQGPDTNTPETSTSTLDLLLGVYVVFLRSAMV